MPTLQSFRKKPVVIQAARWYRNGDHPDDYARDVQGFENGELRDWTGAEVRELGWEGQIVRYFRRPDIPGDQTCRNCTENHECAWLEGAKKEDHNG